MLLGVDSFSITGRVFPNGGMVLLQKRLPDVTIPGPAAQLEGFQVMR